jgi:hypothetical protein
MEGTLALIASLSGLFIAGANCAIFVIIKFNDIKHISEDIREIKNSISCIDKKLYTNAEKIGEIEGRCKANHG